MSKAKKNHVTGFKTQMALERVKIGSVLDCTFLHHQLLAWAEGR